MPIYDGSGSTALSQITSIVRDSAGNITSYVENGATYYISYNADGSVATVLLTP